MRRSHRSATIRVRGFGPLGVLVFWTIWSVPPGAVAQQLPDFEPVKVLPRPVRPITRPNIVSANRAAGKLNDAELVLGVAIGDEARAYPINMLTGPMREIINDRLGGRAIAATW